MVPPNPTDLIIQKANLRVLKLTSLKLTWINNNYHVLKNVSVQYFFRLKFFLEALF